MRFAGTCSRYSNSAIPQLTVAAIHHGLDCMLRRCPYQANVMNRLEPMRRIAAVSAGCCSMEVGMEGQGQEKAVIIAEMGQLSSVSKRMDPIRTCGDRIRGSFRHQTRAFPTS